MVFISYSNKGGETIKKSYEFYDSEHGWVGDFTDYPVDFDQDIYKLDKSNTQEPSPCVPSIIFLEIEENKEVS